MRLISREVLRGELCLVNQIRIPFVDRGSARMDTTMDRPQVDVFWRQRGSVVLFILLVNSSYWVLFASASLVLYQ